MTFGPVTIGAAGSAPGAHPFGTFFRSEPDLGPVPRAGKWSCPGRVREGLMTTAVPLLERQVVLAALGSSNRGLSAGEAAARRAES